MFTLTEAKKAALAICKTDTERKFVDNVLPFDLEGLNGRKRDEAYKIRNELFLRIGRAGIPYRIALGVDAGRTKTLVLWGDRLVQEYDFFVALLSEIRSVLSELFRRANPDECGAMITGAEGAISECHGLLCKYWFCASSGGGDCGPAAIEASNLRERLFNAVILSVSSLKDLLFR